MPPLDLDAMKEDHRHRILKNCKSQGAEEKHGDQQDAPDHLLVLEKFPDFVDQRRRLSRDDEFQIFGKCQKQPVFRHDVRERQQNEDQQGYQRQQRVIRDRPCKQDALIGAKLLCDGEGKAARGCEYFFGSPAGEFHENGTVSSARGYWLSELCTSKGLESRPARYA